MAHEFETGLFVQKPAWHQLGIVLEDYPNPQKAFQCSGLDWEVKKEQLLLPSQNLLTDRYAITRSSDNRILGYSGAKYEVYQNEKAFEWVTPLVDSGIWKIDAAGSLKMGEVCWILLKQDEYDFIPGDTLKEYLLLTWAHNGHLTNIIQPTSIRVVCNNTLQASLSNSNQVKIRHTSTIFQKMDYVQDLLKQSGESFENQRLAFEKMLGTTLTDSQLERFVDTQLPVPVKDGRGKTLAKKKNETMKQMVFGAASGHKELGIINTAYGLYQAIVEANEHVFVNKNTDPGMNILFGTGFRNNKESFEEVMKLAS